MDIGEQQRVIIVEPIEVPAPDHDQPVFEPVEEPVHSPG
jgi:hypothetical protein